MKSRQEVIEEYLPRRPEIGHLCHRFVCEMARVLDTSVSDMLTGSELPQAHPNVLRFSHAESWDLPRNLACPIHFALTLKVES